MAPKILTTLALTAICVVFWIIDGPYIRDLQPNQAAALIAGRPEFNRWFAVAGIQSIERCGPSSMKSCSFVEFTYQPIGKSAATRARVQFNFDSGDSFLGLGTLFGGGAWQFNDFWDGFPPSVASH